MLPTEFTYMLNSIGRGTLRYTKFNFDCTRHGRIPDDSLLPSGQVWRKPPKNTITDREFVRQNLYQGPMILRIKCFSKIRNGFPSINLFEDILGNFYCSCFTGICFINADYSGFHLEYGTPHIFHIRQTTLIRNKFLTAYTGTELLRSGLLDEPNQLKFLYLYQLIVAVVETLLR